MKIWVKRSSDSEEEALKVTLDELSDTSDLIQEAVKLFAFGPDNNIALKASQISVHSEDGHQLSNRQELHSLHGTLTVRPKPGAITSTTSNPQTSSTHREPGTPPRSSSLRGRFVSTGVQSTPGLGGTPVAGRFSRTASAGRVRASTSSSVGGATPTRGKVKASPSPAVRRAVSGGRRSSGVGKLSQPAPSSAQPSTYITQQKTEAPIPPQSPPPVAYLPGTPLREGEVSPHIRDKVAQALSGSPVRLEYSPGVSVAPRPQLPQQPILPVEVPTVPLASVRAASPAKAVVVDAAVAKANVFRKLTDIWDSLDAAKSGAPKTSFPAHDFKPEWGVSVCGLCRLPRALHDLQKGGRQSRSVSPTPNPSFPPTPQPL